MINMPQKLYAAYCAGYAEVDSTKACFPLVENALRDAGLKAFTEEEARVVLEKSFGDNFPVDVLRQVLTWGLKKLRLKMRKGGYYVFAKEDSDGTRRSDFDEKFKRLVSEYKKYCLENGFPDEPEDKTGEKIVASLTAIDAAVLSRAKPDEAVANGRIEYSWYKFIEHCSDTNSWAFEFIMTLCLSNLRVESLLYAPQGALQLKGLTVYLDTPIVYALYGLSDETSNKQFERIVDELLKSGCRVQILDRNDTEFTESLRQTAEWAYGPRYAAVSASPSARAMKAKWPTKLECTMGCRERERELFNKGISIKATEYSRSEDRFQIDEMSLQKRIEALYRPSRNDSWTRERLVETDVTALSMIYRMRHGNVAYRLEHSQHVMLTQNSALAKAAKLFDRETRRKEHRKGAIPACVHSDLVATLLWVANPEAFGQYRKDRLLALCYEGKLPGAEMSKRFMDTLDEARRQKRITPESYVLLKCGTIVENILMRMTNGDAESVTVEMLEKILESIGDKQKRQFDKELQELNEQIAQQEDEIQDLRKTAEVMNKEQNAVDEREKRRAEKAESYAAWIVGIVVCMALIAVGCLIGAVVQQLAICATISAVAIVIELLRLGSSWSLIGILRCALARKLKEM